MGRWLCVVFLVSATALALEQSAPKTESPDSSRKKALENALRGIEKGKDLVWIKGQAFAVQPERCAHIVLMPADPDVDPKMVMLIPKEKEGNSSSGRMPKINTMPPCQEEHR
jgi:hypothetical protein